MRVTHEDGFGNNTFINDMLWHNRGYEKTKIYVWVSSDGSLLTGVSPLKCQLELKGEMEEYAKRHNIVVRLIEFCPKETKCKFIPPVEEGDDQIRGGSAIGGPSITNIEGVLQEFKRVCSKQYPAKDVTYRIERNAVYVEFKNVRCCVAIDPDSEIDAESGLKKQWVSYVTMIENWNSEYHNVCVGKFTSAEEAVTEAFIAFVRYQIEEQIVEDFF